MAKTKIVLALGLTESLLQWNKKLKVERSADGESVIASAKTIDVTGDDLKQLADIIGDDWTVSFGRSGSNFRMMIW